MVTVAKRFHGCPIIDTLVWRLESSTIISLELPNITSKIIQSVQPRRSLWNRVNDIPETVSLAQHQVLVPKIRAKGFPHDDCVSCPESHVWGGWLYKFVNPLNPYVTVQDEINSNKSTYPGHCNIAVTSIYYQYYSGRAEIRNQRIKSKMNLAG